MWARSWNHPSGPSRLGTIGSDSCLVVWAKRERVGVLPAHGGPAQGRPAGLPALPRLGPRPGAADPVHVQRLPHLERSQGARRAARGHPKQHPHPPALGHLRRRHPPQRRLRSPPGRSPTPPSSTSPASGTARQPSRAAHNACSRPSSPPQARRTSVASLRSDRRPYAEARKPSHPADLVARSRDISSVLELP
jgi:hypothetical protein